MRRIALIRIRRHVGIKLRKRETATRYSKGRSKSQNSHVPKRVELKLLGIFKGKLRNRENV